MKNTSAEISTIFFVKSSIQETAITKKKINIKKLLFLITLGIISSYCFSQIYFNNLMVWGLKGFETGTISFSGMGDSLFYLFSWFLSTRIVLISL